jgi:hypothetical protein
MKIFKIELTEILSKTIEVEADTADEAITLVNEKYQSEEIILDESNFIEYKVREIIEEIY